MDFPFLWNFLYRFKEGQKGIREASEEKKAKNHGIFQVLSIQNVFDPNLDTGEGKQDSGDPTPWKWDIWDAATTKQQHSGCALSQLPAASRRVSIPNPNEKWAAGHWSKFPPRIWDSIFRERDPNPRWCHCWNVSQPLGRVFGNYILMETGIFMIMEWDCKLPFRFSTGKIPWTSWNLGLGWKGP